MSICDCGKPKSPTARTCWECHTKGNSHPLRRCGRSLRSIAKEAGLAYTTVKRAAQGEHVARSTAKRLSKVTGIDERTLLIGWFL